MKRKDALILVLFIIVALFEQSSFAGYELFILDNKKDSLFRSNTDNVSADTLVHAYGDFFWADLAPSDTKEHLFGARINTGNDSGAIVRIRESDGQVVSEIEVDQPMKSIAFDAENSMLYGINRDNSDNRLFTVDLDTGVSTLIGDTEIPSNIWSLAYDPLLGLLYASNDNLYKIDPGDASMTFIGDLPPSQVFGLACNPDDGLLYGTDATTDSLYIINRDTASVTQVGGPYDNATFGTGLSFSNPIPEPATLLLLGLGASVLRRRRRA